MVRGYISDNFGKKYLPESPNQYASKENSQEAHEAIRPSDVNVMAESLKDMEADGAETVPVNLASVRSLPDDPSEI
ncbi:DNA topoisomerase I [Escherichia coli]|uniref:DNA topoisomerase I n=1 Tax=Escherichia coli TaxID=562 RepID=A0A2X3LUP4_ECOLX|nr:DNA topoisomerase I [Escherichia coli]